MTKRGRIFYFYFNPFVDDWQKGGEVFGIYACFWKRIYVFAYMFCVLQIGEKGFDVFHACLCMFIYLYLHSCLVSLCALLPYLFISCDAWVKGELLWSFTLIHTYITPWVLSSSKRGRLLAQRPSTLVLMMINSCSYSLLMILCLISLSYLIEI